MSRPQLLLQILSYTNGMTKEELAKAVNNTVDYVRSQISIFRKEGYPIVDYLIEGNTDWTNKKEYKLAATSEEFYNWQIRQQGKRIKPLLGAPRV